MQISIDNLCIDQCEDTVKRVKKEKMMGTVRGWVAINGCNDVIIYHPVLESSLEISIELLIFQA